MGAGIGIMFFLKVLIGLVGAVYMIRVGMMIYGDLQKGSHSPADLRSDLLLNRYEAQIQAEEAHRTLQTMEQQQEKGEEQCSPPSET